MQLSVKYTVHTDLADAVFSGWYTQGEWCQLLSPVDNQRSRILLYSWSPVMLKVYLMNAVQDTQPEPTRQEKGKNI